MGKSTISKWAMFNVADRNKLPEGKLPIQSGIVKINENHRIPSLAPVE